MTHEFDDLWRSYQTTQFLLTQPFANHLSFAIITACNPQGQQLNQSQNRLKDKQLLKEIEQLRCPYRAVLGADKDLSYFEKSWAIFIDKGQAIKLGEQFVQNAIYYVNQGKLTLIPVLLSANEIDLGAFHLRSNLVSDFPDVLTYSKHS
ncbi:DUF3293 domain-containing protein [Parashewanella spongiae]|uniref:DUF3293 domain-containing protein n=1 Tax=Parashewanella spongiae TaxID=342950 RepID=A0A3A6U0J6_9GAMM|nr:DUF3293 domain-containing protein [Parashewanella spongiae]MCL1077375.1 DUF3293 domain-containing protein [Parashewanella spongiae]RJY18999.1 DUF3293 domain-containing protein [Parashewanella spongiae]